jgi:hypothetical protein
MVVSEVANHAEAFKTQPGVQANLSRQITVNGQGIANLQAPARARTTSMPATFFQPNFRTICG